MASNIAHDEIQILCVGDEKILVNGITFYFPVSFLVHQNVIVGCVCGVTHALKSSYFSICLSHCLFVFFFVIKSPNFFNPFLTPPPPPQPNCSAVPHLPRKTD